MSGSDRAVAPAVSRDCPARATPRRGQGAAGMCGIVGYLGNRPAAEVLLGGLRRVEYRGYDSAGLATVAGGKVHLRKTVGRVDRLADLVAEEPAPGSFGIAHTRW